MGVRNYFPSSIAKRSRERYRVCRPVVRGRQTPSSRSDFGFARSLTVCADRHLAAYPQSPSAVSGEIERDRREHFGSAKVERSRYSNGISADFLLKGYQTTSSHVRFNVILGEPHGLQVGELDQQSEVVLDE
ncbi:MAG: hypothetical protein HC895_04705 [Leptolyngbyaceae cyanobacterium SM1_3_5]|nr:hypothetical protein [Leptolyngbyaceae cyanobacterium SM1_3_5]